MRWRLVLAVFALSPSACGFGPAADFEVPITRGSAETWTLLINDDSGLVTGGRSAEAPRSEPNDGVVAFPDHREVEIGWTGGACEHRPRMQISGDVDRLRIDVYNPRDAFTLSCPSIGILLRVRLSLTEPVDTDAIDLEVHYE